MTIPTSVAGTAKANLYTAISTQSTVTSTTAPVLLTYDEPGKNNPDDIIMVGDVVGEMTPAALVGGGGAGWLEERFTIEIVCRAFGGGDHAQTVFERVQSLWAAVQTAVRTDPSLGTGVLTAYPGRYRITSQWEVNNKGRTAYLNAEIFCSQML